MPKHEKIACVIKEKVADHYFIALTVFGNVSLMPTVIKQEKLIINAFSVDSEIRRFNWDSLICYEHTRSYELLVEKFQQIYECSQMTVLLKRRNPASPWIDSEIMELCLLKNRLQKNCRANPSDNLLKEEYRITRNK